MPKTRIFMMLSTGFLLACLFSLMLAPNEALEPLGISLNEGDAPAIQLLNAAFLGFALANWMAKDNMIGGIYARPIAAGNFLHFGVGTIALFKAIIPGNLDPGMIVAAIGYGLFAIGFGWLVFGQGPACSVAGNEEG